MEFEADMAGFCGCEGAAEESAADSAGLTDGNSMPSENGFSPGGVVLICQAQAMPPARAAHRTAAKRNL